MSESQDPELSGPFGNYEILKLIGMVIERHEQRLKTKKRRL